MRIEKVITDNRYAHIIMSRDVSAIGNTGFIIVRNSRWALQFLADCREERYHVVYHTILCV